MSVYGVQIKKKRISELDSAIGINFHYFIFECSSGLPEMLATMHWQGFVKGTCNTSHPAVYLL